MDKRCARCRRIKPIEQFSLNRSNRDGYQKRCKECVSEHLNEAGVHEASLARHKEYYQENKQSFLEKMSVYRKTDRGKEAIKKGQTTYWKNYPDKYKANYTVSNAVRLGKLPRASSQICSICKVKQANEWHHHNGYDEKHLLDVVAVCENCHESIHHG